MSLLLLLRSEEASPPAGTYDLTIAGVTKTWIEDTLSITETTNGQSTLTLEVASVDGSYRPAIGAEVILRENGTRIFGGYIDQPTEVALGIPGGPPFTTKISCVDFNSITTWRTVSGTIVAGTMKAALQWLITNYLGTNGVTLHAGQIDGPALPALTFDGQTTQAVLEQIAAHAGAVGGVNGGYLFGLDYNKVLRMYAPGSAPAPFNVNPALNAFVLGDISADRSEVEYANRINVLYGDGPREITHTATGNGTASAFPLPAVRVVDRGYVINGGVYETMGPSGATWRYEPPSPSFGPAGSIVRIAAPANGNIIEYTYTAQYPAKVERNNTAEQALRGIREKTVHLTDVFDVVVAGAVGDTLLARASTVQIVAGYDTEQQGIKPGQTQSITDTTRNLSGTYLVTEVHTRDVALNRLVRTVTAVSGTAYPGSWRDDWRQVVGGGGAAATNIIVAVQQPGGNAVGGGSIDLTFPNSHTWRLKSDTNAGGGSAAFVIDDRSNETALGVDQLVYVRETAIGTVPGRYRLFPKSTVDWYIGGPTLGNYVWEIRTRDIHAQNGYYERGRSTRMGEWIAVAYSASNFTASGAMTWTVEAVDQVTYAYTLVGKTMSVGFSIAASTVGGTVSTDLMLAIPGSATAAKQMGGGGVDLSDNGTRSVGSWVVTAGGSVIILRKGDFSNWTASTNNTAVTGVVTFEIN